jgi:hypothetical protein
MFQREPLRPPRDRPLIPIPVVVVSLDDQEAIAEFQQQLDESGQRRARVYVRSSLTTVGCLDFEGDPQTFGHYFSQWQETMEAKDAESSLEVGPGFLPPASVVVPTLFARTESLLSCVHSILRLDYTDFEVVIVDNRRTAGVVPKGFPTDHRLRIVHQPRPGISAARNKGVATAQNAIIAFTDDDVDVHPSWLHAIVQPMVDNNVAAVTGFTAPKQLATHAHMWFEEYYGGFGRGFSRKTFQLHEDVGGRLKVEEKATDGSSARLLPLHVAAGTCGVGANMAFRRSNLEQIGGFDISLGAGTAARGGEESAAFAQMLMERRTIVYEPAAFAQHRHRDDYPSLLKQVQQTGISITAMLTAVSLANPTFRRDLFRALPSTAINTARSLLSGSSISETAHQQASYPKNLRRHEVVGLLIGPVSYLRSRFNSRRWDAERNLR